MTKEIKEFIKAYVANVGAFEERELVAFFNDALSSGMSEYKLHRNHECYSSVTDALGMFEAGIDFQKKQK